MGKVNRKKAKVSKVKRNNIRKTKLSQQGKLKNKRNKKTLVKPRPQPVQKVHEDEEEEVESDHGEDLRSMVEAEDLEFLQQAAARGSYGMLANMVTESQRKRKMRDDDDDDQIEKGYEDDGETRDHGMRTRYLLPIKEGTDIVRRVILEKEDRDFMAKKRMKKGAKEEIKKEEDDEEEEKNDEDDDIKIEKPERDVSHPVTVANMLVWREQAIARYKFLIGTLSSGLLENPQEKVMNISRLLEIYDDWQPELQVTLKKLVVVSLLEVFKDILPSYHIKHQDDENIKLKKETRLLQTFEKRMLKGYRTYLTKLEKLASRLYKRRGDTRLATQHDISLGELAVKCMCELLKTHPYFNYSKNIVQLLTPYLDNKYIPVRTMIADTYKSIFNNDKRGEITLDIVRRINDLVKKRKHSVKCEVISVFTALSLDNINLDDDKQSEIKEKKALAKKSRIINLSKKEKKRRKKLEEVEKELIETKAEENKKNRHSVLTEVTKIVFMIYFRVIKQAPSSGLLSVTLQGLAKFAHCINLDFYHDLVKVLNKLMEDENLRVKEQLNCELTIFSILSGHGEAFNIDPNKFYSHFYRTMLEIRAGKMSQNSALLIDCLEKVMAGSKKKLTFHRLLAFAKRLGIVTLQQEHHTALACLAVIKRILQSNKSVDRLLEADYSVGQGIYMPELPEPEHCNASSTALFELSALMRHYHPTVRQFATHIAHGVPATGDKSLPLELSKLTSKEVLESFDPSLVVFKPSIPPPSKKEILSSKYRDIKDQNLSLLCNKVLSTKFTTDFTPLYHQRIEIKLEDDE